MGDKYGEGKMKMKKSQWRDQNVRQRWRMEDENEEELVEKLEWEIELVEKLEWEIDEQVIKGGRSELEKGFLGGRKFEVFGRIFWRENFGCLREFWEIEEKFERKKIPKEREF